MSVLSPAGPKPKTVPVFVRTATGSPGCERGTDVASSGPSIRVGGQTRAAREVYECCCSACRWAGAKA